MITQRSNPVRLTDEGAAPASNHAQVQAKSGRVCHVTSTDRRLPVALRDVARSFKPEASISAE
jgi:hypothetical protein